jgi:hypothetical protein
LISDPYLRRVADDAERDLPASLSLVNSAAEFEASLSIEFNHSTYRYPILFVSFLNDVQLCTLCGDDAVAIKRHR